MIRSRMLAGMSKKEAVKDVSQENNLPKREVYKIAMDMEVKAYEPACIFCGQAKGIKHIKGKNICPACLDEISNL